MGAVYYVHSRLVYSGKTESGASFFCCSSVFFFLRGLFSSVYGERRGTTLPERKASFPKPQTSRVGGEEEGRWRRRCSVSNLCFPPGAV